WEEVKHAAREERRSGHPAARALEGAGSSCWRRAQFLAVRAELSEAWRPRNAQEQHLIDQMAQWQAVMEFWQDTFTIFTALVARRKGEKNRGGPPWEPPRIADAEALEGAVRMVERFQRLYLRSLRVLQDQRRIGPPVIVRRAAQVNIAQQQ